MGGQTKTVFILQNAKVPARSVWEQCFGCPLETFGSAAPALAAGLSLAELALGCQLQQSSLWRLLPCSTHTQPLSRLRDCTNVHSSGSWLVHLCFSTLPFLVKTKKKKGAVGQKLLSCLSFGVASSQLWIKASKTLQIPLECFWLCEPEKTDCKTRNISNVVRDKKTLNGKLSCMIFWLLGSSWQWRLDLFWTVGKSGY